MYKKFANVKLTIPLIVTIIMLLSLTASAARPASGNTEPIGNDISWPQCNGALPKNQAFGIVGVNGGLARTTNPCMAQQLTWAASSTGKSGQPKIQLYVNTANPGQVIDQTLGTWPTSSTQENPYGECDGTNTIQCSWQYGWNRAVQDVVERFAPAALAAGVSAVPADYTWWLDVETENSWQTGSSEALVMNAATLEAMTEYFESVGAKVGIYSTSYQWGQIVGALGEGSSLNGLDSWIPGARNLKSAKSKCSLAPLTIGGKVTLTQYVSGSFDYDYSCVQ